MTATLCSPKAGETIWIDFEGQEIGLELAMLTPEKARDLLDNYNKHNRKISSPEVLKLTRDITDGVWLFTGEPIIVGEDGNMCDGQHRCQAVVDSWISIPVLFVYNISRAAMAAIDQGKSRTVRDILRTSGPTAGEELPNDTVISATAKLLMEGNRSLWRYTDNRQRIAMYVQAHSGLLIDVASWAKSVYHVAPPSDVQQRAAATSRERKCVAPATVAALSLVMEDLGGDRDEVRDFFEKLVGKARADNDIEHGSYNALRWQLINRTPLNRGSAKYSGLMMLFEALVISFNRIKVGTPIKKLVIPKDAKRFYDELPKIPQKRSVIR